MKVNEQYQKPSYEFYNTYPMVTRHVIIPNTYIETISHEDNLQSGLNVIKTTVLLRTYRPPSGFYKDKGYFGLENKANKNLNTYKIIENIANTAWRIVMTSGYIIDNSSYVGSGESTDDDVYYNVDYELLAAKTFLATVGLI